MESSQRAYPRVIYKNKKSLLINIPKQIAYRMDLAPGQYVLVGTSDGVIIVKPMDAKLAKKDLRAELAPEGMPEKKGSPAEKGREKKPKYEDPFDDPDFDPLEKLRIK